MVPACRAVQVPVVRQPYVVGEPARPQEAGAETVSRGPPLSAHRPTAAYAPSAPYSVRAGAQSVAGSPAGAAGGRPQAGATSARSGNATAPAKTCRTVVGRFGTVSPRGGSDRPGAGSLCEDDGTPRSFIANPHRMSPEGSKQTFTDPVCR
ncbi:hypothetical protein GCM10022244_30010 [Streptomyces gulbargensis]|uniref:Uncharacterized protein n=1 Tax=Streptomyces gulbargensis TaxID=364901 RepID=A0ABP7MAV6_9ACTN